MIVADLNKKSILFEIVNRKNPGVPVESYILTIPPENIEIEEPQRVSRTKTWGGIFVDDYGPDNMKIILSGSTGGSKIRKTHALGETNDFDGRSAFYYLRDRIMRYKSTMEEMGKVHQEYDLIYYDLSTVTGDFRGAFSKCELDAYVVSLEKFKMTRSKEKPLFFNYNIELFVLRPLGTFTGEAKPPSKISNPVSSLAGFRKALNSVQAIFGKVKSIKDQIENVMDLFEEVSSKIVSFYSQSLDILTYPLGLINRLFGSVSAIVTTLDQIPDSTLDTIFTIRDDALSCIENMKQLGSGIGSLVVYGKTPEARGMKRIPTRETLDRVSTLAEQYKELSIEESQIKDLVLAKGREAAIQDNIDVYGYVNVTANGRTSMEGLAAEYYGDASLWEIIAVSNDIKSEDDIVLGTVIKVPVILQGGTVANNYVFTDDLRDVYGSDIRIDGSGNIIAAAAGDLAVIEGVNNLIQAINLRLNEGLGSRLRLTVYGIKNSVGSASNNVPISYILANIKDTVMQDPRVANITNIKLKGDGDKLSISFSLETIRINEIVPYAGVI